MAGRSALVTTAPLPLRATTRNRVRLGAARVGHTMHPTRAAPVQNGRGGSQRAGPHLRRGRCLGHRADGAWRARGWGAWRRRAGSTRCLQLRTPEWHPPHRHRLLCLRLFALRPRRAAARVRAMSLAPALQFSHDQADAWDQIAEALGAAGVDLIEWHAQPEGGSRRVLAVVGKAGSGKTMLLAELCKALAACRRRYRFGRLGGAAAQGPAHAGHSRPHQQGGLGAARARRARHHHPPHPLHPASMTRSTSASPNGWRGKAHGRWSRG